MKPNSFSIVGSFIHGDNKAEKTIGADKEESSKVRNKRIIEKEVIDPLRLTE